MQSRMGRAGRAATIAHVAARAGVSTATVSRVLANEGWGRPDTRRRVMAAVGELDYRPSSVARSLKLRATHTLGLLITDIQNPFYPELVRAIEDAARDLDYAILLGNGAEDPKREAAYLELLARRRVDGILIAASSLTERHGRWLGHPPVPIVLVNCALPDGDVPAVLCDNRDGGRLAARHLLELGHRRLGHLAVPQPNPAATERLAGIRDELAAWGLDGLRLDIAVGDGHVAGGERAMRELLERDPAITGILAFNDLTALGALRAARVLGRRVPAEISLVGFDDIDLAAYTDPPLTTVVQPTAEMGRWAVAALIARIATPVAAAPTDEREATEGVHRFPVRLEVRGSTGPPYR